MPARASAIASARRGVIRAFEKIRNHYGINRVGQIGALAALRGPGLSRRGRRPASRARASIIAAIARANGLAPLASAANFVTIDCGRDGAFARRVLDGLLARDVFARKPAVAPLDRCIRVSCGRDEDLAIFADAVPLALAAAG